VIHAKALMSIVQQTTNFKVSTYQ